MRCNGFKCKNFFGQQKCEEFLAFSSLEVRFLVDSSSCNNNKSLTNAKIEHLCHTVFRQPDTALKQEPQKLYAAHAYTNNSDDGHWASARAVRVVQLFSMTESRTERLRVLLPASNSRRCIAVRTLSSGHWCLRTFQWNTRRSRMVAAQKRTASIRGVWSKKYCSSFSCKLILTALCCHKIGTTERLHSWYCGKLDQLQIS